MAKKKSYRFIPAYYEWHLVDDKGKVILCMEDPIEDLMNYCDDEGNDYPPGEEKMMTTIDEVKDMCEDFISSIQRCFEDNPGKSVDGNTEKMFSKLPKNAADIMAEALFYAYCA